MRHQRHERQVSHTAQRWCRREPSGWQPKVRNVNAPEGGTLTPRREKLKWIAPPAGRHDRSLLQGEITPATCRTVRNRTLGEVLRAGDIFGLGRASERVDHGETATLNSSFDDDRSGSVR